MKIRDVAMCLVGLVWLGGCAFGEATYEIFVEKMEFNMRIWRPNEYMINNVRQIYDENRYIYILRHNPEGCIRGILTNRDDKPEKAVGWIILSGKENCKQQQAYSLF